MVPSSHRITLCNITIESLPDLMELHTRVFPVSYGQKFYDEVLHAGDLAKLIYCDDQYAGAICCRLEYSKNTDYTARIYMMTLGILKNYRNQGLGTLLIEHMIETAKRITNPLVTSLYLHVQTVNEAAIRFYIRNGFRIHSVVHDYYKLIENRDAYILVRPIFPYQPQQQPLRQQPQPLRQQPQV